jgi:hypothetical protein
MRFSLWIINEEMTLAQATELFGYRAGDVITANDLTSRYRKLMMQYHPDRNPGDDRAALIARQVTDGNDALKYLINKPVPNFGGAAPRPEPKPTPKPAAPEPEQEQVSPVKNWNVTQNLDRRSFGKWLHSGITYIDECIVLAGTLRKEEKVDDLFQSAVNAVIDMRHGFDLWKSIHKEPTLITVDDFNNLIEAVSGDDYSVRGMKKSLKVLKKQIYAFYDKYIRDFKPGV